MEYSRKIKCRIVIGGNQVLRCLDHVLFPRNIQTLLFYVTYIAVYRHLNINGGNLKFLGIARDPDIGALGYPKVDFTLNFTPIFNISCSVNFFPLHTELTQFTAFLSPRFLITPQPPGRTRIGNCLPVALSPLTSRLVSRPQ